MFPVPMGRLVNDNTKAGRGMMGIASLHPSYGLQRLYKELKMSADGLMKVMQIVRVVIIVVSAASVFACLTYQGSMEREFLTSRRLPVPSAGQVIPLSIKSSTVYVTSSENANFLWAAWGSYAAFLIGAVSVMSHRKWPIRFE